VADHRIRFNFLLRRALWQGRSEVRRDEVAGGIAKELSRNFDGHDLMFRRISLGMI
jgi:hypothetical protein